MKVFIFLGLSILVVQATSIFDSVMEEWHAYKLQYNKSYSSDSEEEFRMKVFMDNKQKIEDHNARFERGEVSFKMGLNTFSDLLLSEAIQMLHGYNRTEAGEKLGSFVEEPTSTFILPAIHDLPKEVNWTAKGAVTPVKDQGNCRSGWAFSATGVLEGQNFRKTGKLVSLSEQNLIDCSRIVGNNGCRGGGPIGTFLFIKLNNGIDTEESYPYTGKENSPCKYNPKTRGATVRGFRKIKPFSESHLQAAVANIGPISVLINSKHDSFLHYKTGIYSEPKCSSINLDHGVLVVGYGVDNATNEEYWLIKNSLGTSWGENGYMRMARNKHNMCGIATKASYPLV